MNPKQKAERDYVRRIEHITIVLWGITEAWTVILMAFWLVSKWTDLSAFEHTAIFPIIKISCLALLCLLLLVALGYYIYRLILIHRYRTRYHCSPFPDPFYPNEDDD